MIAYNKNFFTNFFALLGAHAGSLGGVNAKEKSKEVGKEVFIVGDHELKNREGMITGANKDDVHLRNVNVERDIPIDKWADLRTVSSGEICLACEKGRLKVIKSLEIGHIFKLGTKYSESMGATILDENGKSIPIVMGSYGIGVERIMASAIEQNHDKNGIIWNESIAPFDVVITVTNPKQKNLLEAVEKLYNYLQKQSFEVLLDDRKDRPGVKFKDADLIGIPYRIIVGKKAGEGIIELSVRKTNDIYEIRIENATDKLKSLKLSTA